MSGGCAEWTQYSNLGSDAERLVWYKNCSRRLYCKDGGQIQFAQNQTPDVNACQKNQPVAPQPQPVAPQPQPQPQPQPVAISLQPPASAPGNAISCNRVTNSHWFCDFKFPSASSLGGETTESTIYGCQKRCFDNASCGGWSLRQRDGACQQFSTSGQWPYKHQMVQAGGWIAGPRLDVYAIGKTPGETPDTNTSTNTGADTNTGANANASASTSNDTDTSSGASSLWKKHKALIIMAVVALCVIVTGSLSMVLMVVSTSGSGGYY